MALEWLGSSREPSLPDLIARRKYGRAIAVLKAQLERDSPTPQGRLQLADLLVQAGRPAEAVPVFLELADQFSRDGFVAKAIAVLKRVSRIAPDQDVDARLEELVRTQRRLDTGSVPAPPPTTAAFLFEMEEIPEEPEVEADPEPDAVPGTDPQGQPEPEILPEVEPDAEPEPVAEAEPVAEVEPDPEPAAEAEALPEEAPVPDVSPDAEPVADPELQIEPDPEPAASDADREAVPSGSGVKDRIRNAFKRFLRQSVPEEEAVTPEPTAPEADAEPPIEVDTGELAVLRPVPEDGEGLSEAAFHGQLLDTIQGALQQPAPDSAPAPEPGAEPARKLLATPLFRGLEEGELLAVVQELELETCRPGDVIVSEGAEGDRSLFVISSGTVRVFVRGPNGRNVQVGTLTEGDFFGEMSGLSGQPRAATVTAATACELLELARPRVDDIARRHPRVRERLDQHFVQRASSPEAAAVRVVPLEGDSALRAGSVLAAHFGESRWDPRMRLRLARLLIQSGKEDDAVPVLISLADELSRSGDTVRAVAIIKKVEQIQNRHIQQINLAPLERRDGTPPGGAPTPASGQEPEPDSEAFQSWLVDLVRRGGPAARPADSPSPPAGYDGLQTSPLFSGFSEDELVTLFDSFRLRQAEPGEVLVTEGERSDGLFVLCNGWVRVWVRDPSGRDVELCELSEGAFFGEISTLSGRPRSATVCAASRCELLELEKRALEQLADSHPRVRRVLEEFVAARSSSEDVARIRRRAPREGA